MSDLALLRDEIQTTWMALTGQWARARGDWRDSVSNQFQSEFWAEWDREVPALLRALEELDSALDAIDEDIT